MKRKFLSLFLIASMMTTVIGCGLTGSSATSDEDSTEESGKSENEDSSIPEIRFAYNWTGTAETKSMEFEKRLMEYVDEHENSVNFVLEAASDMTLQDKIKVDLAADDLPDVFLYWGGESNIGSMVKNDLLVDVDTYCEASEVLSREQWPESTFVDSTIGDKAYMFPIETFKWFTIYNTALFEQYDLEIPETYEELKEVSEVFIANGITPIAVGSQGGDYGHVFYNELLYQLEGGVTDTRDLAEDGQFASDATLKAAQYIDEMRDAGMFPSDTIANGGATNATILYTQSKAAMMLCAPWLLESIDSIVLDTSVIAPFPTLPDAAVEPSAFNMGSVSEGLCITKKAFDDPAKHEAIVEFCDFLLADETFYIMALTNTMPAKEITVDESELSEWMAKAIDATNGQETYQPLWFLMPTTDVATTYSDALDEIFAGAINAEEFVDKVQTAFDSAQ